MLLQLLIFSGHTQGVNPSESLTLSLLTMTNTQCALSLLSVHSVPCMLKRSTQEKRPYFITTGAPALTTDANLYRLTAPQILLMTAFFHIRVL